MPLETSIALARIAAVRADRNRRISHEKFFGRAEQRWLHSVRVDDLRGNFKESIGLFEPAECPLCAERDAEDGRG